MRIPEILAQCSFEDAGGNHENNGLCPLNDASELETCDVCILFQKRRGDASIDDLRKSYKITPVQAARLVRRHIENNPQDQTPIKGTIQFLENLPNDHFRQIVFDRVNRELNPSSKDQK